MNKLLIQNVGPIKNSSSEYVLFDKLTIFLGPQASGKSTIAKIYSSLVWLEKAIYRKEITKEQYLKAGFFIDEVISYQGIQSYFSKGSLIHYVGDAFEFIYKEEALQVEAIGKKNNFKMPKIMYVPAERNFLAAIPKVEFIKGLPKPLHSFLSEYEDAKAWVEKQKEISLPIDEVKFRYEKENKRSLLVGEGYQTNLLHGSSGFQSLVPLFLVTEYLADLVVNKIKDPAYEDLSVAQKIKIHTEALDAIGKLKDNFDESDYSEIKKRSVKLPKGLNVNLLVEEMVKILNLHSYKSFINIVEEPEQNLYPTSQKQVLFSLLQAMNKIEANKLIITSHSPYILNFITLCTEAFSLYKKESISAKNREKLASLVPQESMVSIESVNVYQLLEDGNIHPMAKDDGFINDQHSLNEAFEDINDAFSEMLDME